MPDNLRLEEVVGKLILSIVFLGMAVCQVQAQSLPWRTTTIAKMFLAMKPDQEGNVLMFGCNTTDPNKIAIFYRPVVPFKTNGSIVTLMLFDNRPPIDDDTWEISDGTLIMKDPIRAAELLELISEAKVFRIMPGQFPTKTFDNAGIDTVIRAVTKACGR